MSDSSKPVMNNKQRAIQAWPALVAVANNRQTITYEMLGKWMSMPPIAPREALKKLMTFCKERGYPPLTVVVVNKETGKPGEGLVTSDNVDADRERAYAFDWSNKMPIEEDLM